MTTTTPVPRLRAYDGPALLSYGFRPFFLLGSIYAGLAVLVWLPVFYGELSLHSAFAPRDWHVHEMLYGYLPAVITGFLFTAIPNWTGRLPIQGKPLLALVLVWIAGRVVVTISADVGWLPAAAIDVGFLALIVAAAAREILAGRNWRNLKVVGLVGLLLAGNGAFHLEAHFSGTADYGVRVGIAVVVLLIALIGGRIIPSFTRNWLARETRKTAFAVRSLGRGNRRGKRSGVVRLGFRPGWSAHRNRAWFRRTAESRAARPLGGRPRPRGRALPAGIILVSP